MAGTFKPVQELGHTSRGHTGDESCSLFFTRGHTDDELCSLLFTSPKWKIKSFIN